MRKRFYAYGAALLLLMGTYVWISIQTHGLESELQGIADEKLAEFRADEPKDLRAQLQIGTSVVATRAYLLFGEEFGKVTLYLQHNNEDSSIIQCYEFFFARDESGVWRETESDMSTSEECTQEGMRILRALDAK